MHESLRQFRIGRPIAALIAVATVALTGPGAGLRAAEPAPAAVATRKVDDATIERLRRLHYTEEFQARMVLVPVSVTDRKGRAITGLAPNDFVLWDEAERQDIRYFSDDAREPVSIAFVLDLSGSMRHLGKLEHAKEAIRFFVDALRPGDRFALIGFTDDQVAWITDFTDDRDNFLRRLAVQEGYGQTALHDAVAATPGLVDARAKGRKAIVLITDGVDNASHLDADEAVAVARRVNVPVYAIGFLSVAPELLPPDVVGTDLDVLGHVARETGGRLFAVHDPDELKEAVATVDGDLRHQYLIGYYPDGIAWNGQFRSIRLEARRGHVRTRSGYHAEP